MILQEIEFTQKYDIIVVFAIEMKHSELMYIHFEW